VRRRGAWTIIAIGVFFAIDAVLFTWWNKAWTDGMAEFAAAAGCIYGGIALLKMEPLRASRSKSRSRT
jgi:hypothetical protein